MTKIPHIIEQLHIQKNKIYNGKITTYKEESSTYKEMSTTYDDKHTIFNGNTTEYTEKYFALHYDHINGFNAASILCRSPACVCRGLFYVL
jgi:hypothetical protein